LPPESTELGGNGQAIEPQAKEKPRIDPDAFLSNQS